MNTHTDTLPVSIDPPRHTIILLPTCNSTETLP